mmetsp:Transcript_32080/g.81618  ORF Transcript_32080/g.81618 Transcript_32080/m.81618 type:complete len:244 (-) Transcript_32080:1719-2450(-)
MLRPNAARGASPWPGISGARVDKGRNGSIRINCFPRLQQGPDVAERARPRLPRGAAFPRGPAVDAKCSKRCLPMARMCRCQIAALWPKQASSVLVASSRKAAHPSGVRSNSSLDCPQNCDGVSLHSRMHTAWAGVAGGAAACSRGPMWPSAPGLDCCEAPPFEGGRLLHLMPLQVSCTLSYALCRSSEDGSGAPCWLALPPFASDTVTSEKEISCEGMCGGRSVTAKGSTSAFSSKTTSCTRA